jgi:hypothetical protein
MKFHEYLLLFVVIAVAALLANLLTLKIAADQVSSSVGSSPLLGLLGSLSKKSA